MTNKDAIYFLNLLQSKCDNGYEAQAIYLAVKALEPRPQGKWIYQNNCWHCSECGEPCRTIGYVGTAKFMHDEFKFCNHCGATMTGGVIENEDSN